MSCGHAAQLDPECDNCKLVPREYLMLKETAINGTVRALKGQTRIGGIEVFSEDGVSKSRKGTAPSEGK